MKKYLGVLVLTLFILTLSACNLLAEESEDVTITFETHMNMDLHPLTYERGETVILPELMSTADMVFSGWFTDEERTVSATDLDDRTEDFTVYAKWEPRRYDVLVDVYREVKVDRLVMNEVAMFIVDDEGRLNVQRTQENPLAGESGWQEAPELDGTWYPDDDGDGYGLLTAWEMNAFVVTPDGRIFSWGDNTYGLLGTDHGWSGSFVEITDRFELSEDERIIEIVGNEKTAFARTDDGRVFAWGTNHENLMGDPELTGISAPTDITDYICGDTDHFLIDIAVSADHAIALTAEHQVLIWGRDTEGWIPGFEFANTRDHAENITDILFRVMGTHVTDMRAAHGTVILVGEGNQMLVLGESRMAQDHTLLEIEGDGCAALAEPAGGGSGKVCLIDIKITENNAFFLYSDGTLTGIGYNTAGLITSKKGYDYYVARPEAITTNFTTESLTMSSSEACALADNGELWCWGDNSSKRLGRNNELLLSTNYAYVTYEGERTDYEGISEDPDSLRSSAGPIFVLSPPEAIIYAPFIEPYRVFDVTRYHIGGIGMDMDADGVVDELIKDVCSIGGGDCDDTVGSVHPDAFLNNAASDGDIQWTFEVILDRVERN